MGEELMKRGRVLLGIEVIAAFSSSLLSATEYHSGDVWGTWRDADNPHIIIADVRVPPGQSLTIEPGCQVLFRGYYKFVVDSAAVLHAVGTETDSILFDEETPGTYWHGIRFLRASSASIISYARLQRGRAMDPLPPEGYGGAVYSHSCSLTLSNSTFTANWAEWAGGAVYCDTADAVIVGNTFVADSAILWGGAICCEFSSATISGNIFNGNWGQAAGGAINSFGAFPLVSNNVFSSNYGSSGGAMACAGDYVPIPSHPVVIDNLFLDNSAFLGGAFLCSATQTTVADNLFLANQASQGGAIGFGNGARPAISRCVFVENVAAGCGYGGVIYANSGTGRIENCTFTQNRADYHGGALAGLQEGNFILKNTILWGDSAGVEQEIYVDGSSWARISYSDVAGGWVGAGNVDLDPWFVAPPESVQLRWGSPCIDAGDPASALDPDNTRADMGVYFFDQRSLPWDPVRRLSLPGRKDLLPPPPQR
jgi:hypothetical protein